MDAFYPDIIGVFERFSGGDVGESMHEFQIAVKLDFLYGLQRVAAGVDSRCRH